MLKLEQTSLPCMRSASEIPCAAKVLLMVVIMSSNSMGGRDSLPRLAFFWWTRFMISESNFFCCSASEVTLNRNLQIVGVIDYSYTAIALWPHLATTQQSVNICRPGFVEGKHQRDRLKAVGPSLEDCDKVIPDRVNYFEARGRIFVIFLHRERMGRAVLRHHHLISCLTAS